jgi:hypothetical protein
MDDLVILKTYNDAIHAEIARGLLATDGIEAVAVEGLRVDPILNRAFGTVLRVPQSELAKAKALLAEAEAENEQFDPETDDAAEVRCPRCETDVCHFGRTHGVKALFLMGLPYLLQRKRWRCHRCEHVWDDPNQGPRTPSRFASDDPRPVFMLVRSRPGTGLLLGVMIGWVLLLALGFTSVGLAIAGACALTGWLLGRWRKSAVCSDPRCRAALRTADDKCPQCGKTVAGVIRRAGEHYAAVAEIRREFAAMRRRD